MYYRGVGDICVTSGGRWDFVLDEELGLGFGGVLSQTCQLVYQFLRGGFFVSY